MLTLQGLFQGPLAIAAVAAVLVPSLASGQQVVNLWPGTPPGETAALPPEADTTGPDGNLVAGRRVARIGNVSTPSLTIFPAPADKATGASIVVSPGGGYSILAWDLEGTEVAEWLNSIGVTAFVLKYRVPAREQDNRRRAAVQDAQRAVSLVRSRATEFGVNPNRIGILGFSAGGEAAALTALLAERTYPAADRADNASTRPDFAVLIYPAYLANDDNTALRDHVTVTGDAPPTFLAHAHDDRINSMNSVLLYAALKRAGVLAELHVYSKGGHGYGLRETDTPVTTWHHRLADWLRDGGWLKR